MRTVLLCLHGWGGSKESFTELRQALTGTDILILTPDLPGFGNEPEPSRPWNTDDYADWVRAYLVKNQSLSGNEQPLLYILGHSHGGRIAIKLAVSGEQVASSTIGHLYLCAAAGVRRPRHFKRILGLIFAKAGSLLLSIPGLRRLQPLGKKMLYRLVRVHDYEQASPVMRETLIRVTQEDLRPLLPSIMIPTDIFWGTEDQMTPIADAEVMHKAIKGSRLHTYPGVRHAVHRDRAREIAAVIRQQLEQTGES